MPNSALGLVERVVRVLALVGCVWLGSGTIAQTAEAGSDGDEIQSSEQPRIGFSFKDAPFDRVLDFFARQSGVPIIFEADPPAGTLTFVSGVEYDLDGALSVLNLMLRRHDRYLRHEGDFLYLSTLPEAAKRAGESYEMELPPDITPDQIVTVTIPLSHANAALIAEQVKPLLDSFGSVVAVPEQNIVIIVETAAQVERLSRVIRSIDDRRPVDSAYKLFPLKHAQAEAVVQALKGLVGERVQRIIIDKDGQQRVVEDIDVGGLNIQPDARTNSVIVVGPQSRIDTVEKLILLLDASEDGLDGDRRLVTFSLQSVSPATAKERVAALFAGLEEARRPTLVPLEETGKLAIVGSDAAIVQARALIDELDPTAADGAEPEDEAVVVPLHHLSADSAQSLLSRLMTPRQQRLIRSVRGADNRSLVVAGPSEEVAGFVKLVAGIDRPANRAREVRLVRIASADPKRVFDEASRLFDASDDSSAELDRTLDEDSGAVTLIGSRESVDRFVRVLSEADQLVEISTESRTYEVAGGESEELAARLTRVLGVILPGPGARPTVMALPELNQIVVRAEPMQFGLVEGVINQLSSHASRELELEVIRLHSADPDSLLKRARELASAQFPDLAEAEVQFDEASGHLIVSGSKASVSAFRSGLQRAQMLMPPQRTTRFLDIQRANAADLVEPLQAFLASADSIDPGRAVPAPSISVVERTNSLMVVAEPAQQDLIRDYVRRLDVIEQTDLPPLRLLQLRTADAKSIAAMLTDQYRQRPQSERTAKPVEVRADEATNTLIVAAHSDLFDDIKSFVDELNKDRSDGPERVTRLFPLRVARAVDVAQAMDRLYPEPPVPLDRRGRPMPWLREPKQVTVSAEPNSNSLIFDAPADRIESLTELAEQLDRVEVPLAAELRTYRVVNADISVIAGALKGLAQRGVLSAPASAGRQAVQVLIETEPMSKTLIVAGDSVTFEKVEQMLEDLSAVPVQREVRIVPISGQLAADVARRAEQIYEVQTASLPDAEPIDVSVDEQTNSLELVGEKESMTRFLAVLDELQSQTGPAMQIRLVELRAAKAGEVTAFLEELTGSSAAMSNHGGPMPTYEAIESTNSILVAATPEDWSIIQPLIDSLDTAEGQVRPPLRLFRLRSTDATNLATILQQSFDRRPSADRVRQPVDIRADASTNTLIVAAHEGVLPEIERIISDLNDARALDDSGRRIQIFPLRIARAEDLARTIDQMYPEPPMPRDSRGRPRPDLRQSKEIVVRADAATNSLIVDAPSARLAGFEQLVRELDRAQVSDDVEVRTYRVRRAELADVQRTLRELADRNALGASGQASVTITTEARGRTIVVSGPTDIFDSVEKVIESLDSPPDSPTRVLRLYKLEHARADLLAPMLRDTLFDQAKSILGVADGDSADVLNISSDAGSNTLIISAPEPIQDIAQELVKALDTEASASSRAVVRVVSLTYADAASIAPTLLSASGAMDIAGPLRPNVSAIGGVNALLISGSADGVERIADLVASLDTRPVDVEAPGVETFALEHASATEIAKAVERLLVNQLETDPRVVAMRLRYVRDRALPAPTVRVEADERTNSLVVSAPRATLELARAIVDRLDQPVDSANVTMTFMPTRADAKALSETVRHILERTERGQAKGAELLYEPASQAIVVTGGQEAVAQAVDLLSEFDDRAVATPESTMVMIDLDHADALAAAATLTRVLTDQAQWPAQLRRAAESGLPVSDPVFTPDSESNRILMISPTALVPLANKLVDSLDRAPANNPVETRVFHLQQGQAASVAPTVLQALRATASSSEPETSVTAETVSNSIVVVGPPERVAQAEELVGELDGATDTDGIGVRTVKLVHARAEILAPIIESIVQRRSETDLMPSWMLGNYLARGGQVRQRAQVVAEPRLNALIVSGPIGVLDLVEQVVAELDVDPESTAQDRPVRVLAVRNADASALAETISAVFSGDAVTVAPPVVRVDVSSNALVIRASEEQYVRIKEIVDELDAAAMATSRQFRRISVDPSRLEAGQMAELLRDVLEQQTGTTVQVITVEELSEPDSVGDDAGAMLEPMGSVFLPVNAILYAVVALPIEHLDQPEPDADVSEDDGSDEPAVTITVDPATNTLIVSGSVRMTDRIAELAAELERLAPAERTRARVIRLPEGVDPNLISQIIARTARQIGRRTEQNPGGFTGVVASAADRVGGNVIVWANDTDFQSVGPLVAALSQGEASARRFVKVYPLNSIRARRAVPAVRDFISPAPSGRQARRLRASRVVIQGPDGSTSETVLDPSEISISSGPGDASIIVSAPQEAIEAIDSFVSMIDQNPSENRMAIRRYALQHSDARTLAQALSRMFNAQRQQNPDMPRPAISPVSPGNALLVSATAEQHAEILRLLPELDAQPIAEGTLLEVFRLENARASRVQRAIRELLLSRDPARAGRMAISSDDASGVVIFRGSVEDAVAVREIIAGLDTADSKDLPVRTLVVERADVASVAAAITRFLADRDAASRGAGRSGGPTAAITADRRSGSLVVAADDEDFEIIRSLVEKFDAPTESRDLVYRVIRLENARALGLKTTLADLVDEMQYERMYSRNRPAGEPDDRVYIQTDDRLNAVIVVASPQRIESIERIIADLDLPTGEGGMHVMRAVALKHADASTVARVIVESTKSPDWPWWRGRDPQAVIAEVDRSRNMLLLVGDKERVEMAVRFAEEIESSSGLTGGEVTTIRLTHARADRVARAVGRFFQQRARAKGLNASEVAAIGSPDGNVLIISANKEDTALVAQLVQEIDKPELGDDREIEVYVLRNADVAQTARSVAAMFPSRGAPPEERVIVTPQAQSNSLLVSAPKRLHGSVAALIGELDRPPSEQDNRIVTVTLESARASDVAESLRDALPESVKIKITLVDRSNSLLLTGSDEAIELVMRRIEELDAKPIRNLMEFKRVRLVHAEAFDVWSTLRQILRGRDSGAGPVPTIDYESKTNTLAISASADQIQELMTIVKELDVPPEVERRTEFVSLQFADAEQVADALTVFYGPRSVAAATPGARTVTIVPDKASGSLVISADVTEWDGILALLTKLDTKQYDTSRQLAVLKLEYADASSVAAALDEGFRDTLESRVRRNQARVQNQRSSNENTQETTLPVLIRDEDLPTVSAEPETNSLVVFAGRRDLERIQSIVKQIDRAEFVEYPQAKIIPVRHGKPSEIADTVRALYAQRNTGTVQSRRAVLIVGDDSSRMLVVRADERTFAQIEALAEAVQERADLSGVRVRILTLHNVPAVKIRSALEQAFRQTAVSRGESLSIQLDRTNNALVIASTETMFEEIRSVAEELDRPLNTVPEEQGDRQGAAFGGVQIVDVTNNDPESVIAILRAMGVSRPINPERPGLVGDPVQLVAMASRRAIAITGTPADVAVVARLIPLLDQQAVEQAQTAAVVSLDVADATAVAGTLRELLSPREGAIGSTPALAAAEHLRRLSLSRGVDEPLKLDLAVPIRVIPDEQTNAILVASTESNVNSVRELVKMLDRLPVGDAVMIRIFPLNNAAADRTMTILNDLFRQGDVISRAPGTDRSRLPSTAAGHALISNIALSVDERTNSLIVAGREESVALVEVLIKDLDTDQASNWVEPTIIPLQHADPRDLADQLNSVLVDGLEDTPESRSLKRQAGRIRLAAEGGEGEQVLQADLFTPIGTLIILPEPNLQALLVLGSPSNISIVRGLATMLDVEAASASNSVRLFPLVHAAADRVAGVVDDLFRERESLPGFRDEDRLIVSVDTRTNTLIVSTSPASFAVLESLLDSLDTADPNYAIGLHVLPVHNGDAAQLAPKIERLMRERISAAQRSGSVESPMDTFTIESEPGTNSLIIAASDENLQLVRELVDMLTGDEAQELARGMTVEVIALSSTRPIDAAEAVTEFYITPENERRGPGSVAVIPNSRLNALVVRGTPEDVEAIRDMVAQFDTASPTATQDVQRIELNTANAFEVVQLLNSVLSGRTVSGPRSRSGQAVKLRFLRDQMIEHIGEERDVAEAEIDSVIREQVSLTPELRTNSVLVVAPPEVMKFIESMIADLDTTKAGTRQIEKFRLENADARAMARVLQDLFSLRQDGRGRLYLVPSGAGAESEAGPENDDNSNSLGGQGLTPVPDDRQQLAITIDARTNTLIVSATEEYLELVRGVVNDLDSIIATEREQIVLDLQYAQAQTVQDTLQQYFQQESQRIRQVLSPGQSGSLTRQLEQEVTIIGDPKSQKVLISASPRYIETVKSIVRELDAAPPQVVIQVLLAEVTLDDSDQWGISANGFQVGGDNYDIGYLGAGASLATALGVPNLSVSSTDFSLLVRALQAQGKLEILSNPRLTVNNNEQASIQVGENVALPADVETLTDGRTRASVRREDVGVLLSVTPSISSDGFVRLDIQPEISVVTERTTQITEDFEAPIISTRRVDTTVTVRDGQTVVIGGLIQTTKQDRHTKVPLLGDIPFLGIPFRSHDIKNVRTELLMILTPTVIPGGSASGARMLNEDTKHYIDRFVNPESVRDIIDRCKMPVVQEYPEPLLYGPPVEE
ncbi:MAG TPA: hypothetical protein ENJ00_00290 [Phycisphaerales bacterium]|nr:hypothetical protein [Phycisphaerales bacterium]